VLRGSEKAMSYRLELGEPVPEALRAAGVERLQRAAARLRDEHAHDPVAAVHGARKDLKRTRALLRLARPDLSGKAYRRENRELRDIGREMSAGRDAEVMVQTVDALAEQFAGQLPKRQFTALSRRLAAQAAAAREDGAAAGLGDALAAAAGRAAAWPLEGAERSTLRAGVAAAYRRGREAFAVAQRDPSAEHLHEWRKRVKDLWYAGRIIAPITGAQIEGLVEEADELSDVLGDHNDLAVLLEAAGDRPGLRAAIVARRDALRRVAATLGRRLYGEKPKAFARRLEALLAAHEDAHAASARWLTPAAAEQARQLLAAKPSADPAGRRRIATGLRQLGLRTSDYESELPRRVGGFAAEDLELLVARGIVHVGEPPDPATLGGV
jgi:CHAD domain-containing protein